MIEELEIREDYVVIRYWHGRTVRIERKKFEQFLAEKWSSE